MRVILYQIAAKPEHSRFIFRDLKSIKAESGGQVPAEIYEAVYDGDLDIQVPETAKNSMDFEFAELEAVYVRFNLSHPEGFCGRSMTMSDVVEIIRAEQERKFFFCDRFGFEEITFEKEKADLSACKGQKGYDDEKTDTEL